jgi:hypothetical protein
MHQSECGDDPRRFNECGVLRVLDHLQRSAQSGWMRSKPDLSLGEQQPGLVPAVV